MTILFLWQNRKINPVTKPMIIAVNKPLDPSQFRGSVLAAYGSSGTINGVTIMKLTSEVRPTAIFDLAHLYTFAN